MKNTLIVLGLILFSYQLTAQEKNIESQFCSYLKENTHGGMTYVGGSSCLPKDFQMHQTTYSTTAYNLQFEADVLDENGEPIGKTSTFIEAINFIIDEKIKYQFIKGEYNGSVVVNANRYLRDDNGNRVKSQNFDLVFKYNHIAADSKDVKFYFDHVKPRIPVAWIIVENKMVIVDSDPSQH
jgi:hypothetical protein